MTLPTSQRIREPLCTSIGRLTDFVSTPTGSGAPLPSSQAFTYDGNGNRTSFTEDSTPYPYSVATGSNRLLSSAGPSGGKTYTYDAAGNMIGDGTHTYGYDDRGRMVSVDGGMATYEHNGLGQRVRKDAGLTILFVYDEAGRLIGEYDAAGNPYQESVWFQGAPVAELSAGYTFYVHMDHLGSPLAVTYMGMYTLWMWESDPFGATPAQADWDGDGWPFIYNLRFPGQYYDAETGLHYNYFRDYDPAIGRYIESDPIGLVGGLNTYAYVENAPLRWSDPTGLAKWKGWGRSFELPIYSRGEFTLESDCVCGMRCEFV